MSTLLAPPEAAPSRKVIFRYIPPPYEGVEWERVEDGAASFRRGEHVRHLVFSLRGKVAAVFRRASDGMLFVTVRTGNRQQGAIQRFSTVEDRVVSLKPPEISSILLEQKRGDGRDEMVEVLAAS